MANTEKRLTDLEKHFQPQDTDDFLARFPDLDERQRSHVMGAAAEAVMAAYTRLDICVRGEHNEHTDGDEADIKAAHRAVELAMDDAAAQARVGNFDRPLGICGEGPGADPAWPAGIDALLARVGWRPKA